MKIRFDCVGEDCETPSIHILINEKPGKIIGWKFNREPELFVVQGPNAYNEKFGGEPYQEGLTLRGWILSGMSGTYKMKILVRLKIADPRDPNAWVLKEFRYNDRAPRIVFEDVPGKVLVRYIKDGQEYNLPMEILIFRTYHEPMF